jgi:site-specific recombinase XerD
VECVALTVWDLTMEQGYYIAQIRQGKSNKHGPAKVPVDVRQALHTSLKLAHRSTPTAPLFVSFRQGDHSQERPLTGNEVARIVKRRAQAVERALSLHELRTSFITLAFEGGADLTLVQDAARHNNPRTIRRHQTRKENLQRDTVDFVWI